MLLKPTIRVITSMLMIALGFGTVVFSRRTQNNEVKANTRNRTTAIEVAKIEIRNDIKAAIVTLKNVSTKNVNGIMLAWNQGYVTLEFLAADLPDRQRLLPGATFDQMFPISNPSKPLEVGVLAVTFDDKTSDGDAESTKELIDGRRGFIQEMKRLRPLLEAALASPDGDSEAALDRLKSQVEGLPLEKSGDSSAFRSGQTTAREILLNDVQFLKDRQAATGRVQIRNALTSVKQRYDKRIEYDH